MRINKKIEVPQSVIDIKDIFKDNGHELFVVGGAVRDSLLGEAPKDFDLATDAIPEKVKSMLDGKFGFVEEVGESFGVVFVKSNDGEFEVATFREEEGYSDSRRPDEVKFSTIEKDVLRRDLTINALFYDIDKEEVVDLVGGVLDLTQNRRIRTVGDATERFNEDRLRILRAIRFSSRLGFDLDDQIVRSITENPSLEKVSKERVRDELIKCLKSTKNIIKLRRSLNDLGLDNQIFPDLNVISFTDKTNSFELILAIALQYNHVGKLKKTLNKLTYTNDEVSRICFLVDSLRMSIENVFEMKKSFLRSKVSKNELEEFHEISDEGDLELIKVFNLFDLSVSGDDLMKDGFKPGPEMGCEIKRRELQGFMRLLKEKEA
jgi:tRNA nucleotidyltransferase/poly(A) polymerase